MTQETILKYLENNKKQWFTSKKIRENAKIRRGNLSVMLKKLRKYDEVLYAKKIVTVKYEPCGAIHTLACHVKRQKRWVYKHKTK